MPLERQRWRHKAGCSHGETQPTGGSGWPGRHEALWGSCLPGGPTCESMSWPTVLGSPGRNMASQASPCRKRGTCQGFKGSQGHSLARKQQMAAWALGGEQCPLKPLLLLLTNYQFSHWQSQQALQPLIPTSLSYTHSNHEEHTACTCGAML